MINHPNRAKKTKTAFEEVHQIDDPALAHVAHVLSVITEPRRLTGEDPVEELQERLDDLKAAKARMEAQRK